MMGAYDATASPPATLPLGTRVEVTSTPRTGREGFSRGSTGIVVGYATPDLKHRQRWIAESYYVHLDTDAGPLSCGHTSGLAHHPRRGFTCARCQMMVLAPTRGRVFDRDQLEEIR